MREQNMPEADDISSCRHHLMLLTLCPSLRCRSTVDLNLNYAPLRWRKADVELPKQTPRYFS